MPSGKTILTALQKFFDYYPAARQHALETVWTEAERLDATNTAWLTVSRAYRPRFGWRVLLNGRDLGYMDPATALLNPGDEIAFFPPGR
jgi:molybdopterin converting factor small subunit